MTSFPLLVCSISASGAVRYALGDPLVDRYLECVAGRTRPNTVRAVALDLKTFFTVIEKEPVTVEPSDVFEFLAAQRGDRSVVRLTDRESGVSARTIARRVSSVSGFYAYAVARGDTGVRSNPVPRGLATRRQGGRAMSASSRGRSWIGPACIEVTILIWLLRAALRSRSSMTARPTWLAGGECRMSLASPSLVWSMSHGLAERGAAGHRFWRSSEDVDLAHKSIRCQLVGRQVGWRC